MFGDGLSRKVLVGQATKTDAASRVSAGSNLSTRQGTRGYLPLLNQIDLKTSTDPQILQEQIQTLRKELLQLSEPILGLLAPCYLGEDFEVHALDFTGQVILRHYRRSEELPETFAKARQLAASRRYVAVEVYASHVRCVRDDGTTLRVDVANKGE